MREIKFRGIDTASDKWIYGGYVLLKSGVNCILSGEVSHMTQPNQITRSSTYEELNILQFHAVKYKTVGQWTGLLDKQGKEIYEGDIAQDKVNNCIWRYVIQPVSFMGNNLFAVCIWRNFTVVDDETIMGGYTVKDGNWNYISSTLEVIGNIYENPELLSLGQSK